MKVFDLNLFFVEHEQGTWIEDAPPSWDEIHDIVHDCLEEMGHAQDYRGRAGFFLKEIDAEEAVSEIQVSLCETYPELKVRLVAQGIDGDELPGVVRVIAIEGPGYCSLTIDPIVACNKKVHEVIREFSSSFGGTRDDFGNYVLVSLGGWADLSVVAFVQRLRIDGAVVLCDTIREME